VKQRFSKKYLRYTLLLGWFLFPILFSIISRSNISPHYLYITYPSQFLLLALFVLKFPLHKLSKWIIFSLILVSYCVFSFSFFHALDVHGGTDGIYGVSLKHKVDVLEYISSQDQHAHVIFYDYVKPEYVYLQSSYAPHLTLLPHSDYEDEMEGYLLLDFYSRLNFGEQRMSEEETDYYSALPFHPVGSIRLVNLSDYDLT
jgi:hypothetical protein